MTLIVEFNHHKVTGIRDLSCSYHAPGQALYVSLDIQKSRLPYYSFPWFHSLFFYLCFLSMCTQVYLKNQGLLNPSMNLLEAHDAEVTYDAIITYPSLLMPNDPQSGMVREQEIITALEEELGLEFEDDFVEDLVGRSRPDMYQRVLVCMEPEAPSSPVEGLGHHWFTSKLARSREEIKESLRTILVTHVAEVRSLSQDTLLG